MNKNELYEYKRARAEADIRKICKFMAVIRANMASNDEELHYQAFDDLSSLGSIVSAMNITR